MNEPLLTTEFPTAEESPGFLLWQISNRWQSNQRKALSSFNLTHVQFVLLASLVWLAPRERPVSQKELANHAKTDVMMTSQVVRTLERKGLLTRTVNQVDARSILLEPTPEGVALANRSILAVEAVDSEFFEILREDLQQFTSMMRLLSGDQQRD